MKLPAKRLIAVDDAKTNLDEWANALNRHGAAYIQLHFQDQNTLVSECTSVRVIIADRHLILGLGENSL